VKLSEEANDPEINIPRGLVLAISASIILYILVAISAVSVLGWEELSRSSAPFSDIARYALGRPWQCLLNAIPEGFALWSCSMRDLCSWTESQTRLLPTKKGPLSQLSPPAASSEGSD
jgi:amino acid transporter